MSQILQVFKIWLFFLENFTYKDKLKCIEWSITILKGKMS